MVLVQFRVKVPDVERFKATAEKYTPVMEELGGPLEVLADGAFVTLHPSIVHSRARSAEDA